VLGFSVFTILMGSKYSIGTLETSSGSYRTYYYLKNNSGTFLIKELRIEKDK